MPHPFPQDEYVDAEFFYEEPQYAVGAPEVARGISPQALVVAAGLVTASAIGIYFLHKSTNRTHRRVGKAAIKAISREAARTGRVAAKHLGSAAEEFVSQAIQRRVGVSRPKHVRVNYRTVP